MKSTLEISIEQPFEWMRYIKNSIKGLIALGFFLLSGVLLANIWIVLSTEKNNYYSLQKMPSNDVGLVLGTSKAILGGKENMFFQIPYGSRRKVIQRREN